MALAFRPLPPTGCDEMWGGDSFDDYSLVVSRLATTWSASAKRPGGGVTIWLGRFFPSREAAGQACVEFLRRDRLLERQDGS
jgi:hypothetical protein